MRIIKKVFFFFLFFFCFLNWKFSKDLSLSAKTIYIWASKEVGHSMRAIIFENGGHSVRAFCFLNGVI